MNPTTIIPINDYEDQLIKYLNNMRKTDTPLIIGKKIAQNAEFYAINYDFNKETNEHRLATHFTFVDKMVIYRNKIKQLTEKNVFDNIKKDIEAQEELVGYLKDKSFEYAGVSVKQRNDNSLVFCIIIAQISPSLMRNAFDKAIESIDPEELIDTDTIYTLSNKFRYNLHLRSLVLNSENQQFLEQTLREGKNVNEISKKLADYTNKLDGQFVHISNANLDDTNEFIKILFSNQDFLQFVLSSARGYACCIRKPSDIFILNTYPPVNDPTKVYATDDKEPTQNLLIIEPRTEALKKPVNDASPFKLHPNSTSNTPMKSKVEKPATKQHPMTPKITSNSTVTPIKEDPHTSVWKLDNEKQTTPKREKSRSKNASTPNRNENVRGSPFSGVSPQNSQKSHEDAGKLEAFRQICKNIVNPDNKLKEMEEVEGEIDEIFNDMNRGTDLTAGAIEDAIYPLFIDQEFFHYKGKQQDVHRTLENFVKEVKINTLDHYYLQVAPTAGNNVLILVIYANLYRRGSFDYQIYNQINTVRAGMKLPRLEFNKFIYNFASNAIDQMKNDGTIRSFDTQQRKALSKFGKGNIDGCAFTIECSDKKEISRQAIKELTEKYSGIIYGKFDICGFSIDTLEKNKYFVGFYCVQKN